MNRTAPAIVATLATLLAASAPAQTFTDPANLRGERVSARTGRELPIDGGGHGNSALALRQQLRKLNTRASLMLIVAHPDDEDGGMLTYYSRGLGARVAVLTLNRGEGGQNAMTGDFEDALGLLRTQELLSADRYSGVEQMFGTEVDFGFSKTKAEAFKKWGHQRVLYDAVRAVRLFRPLVIASVFSGSVTDGHGQHQVSGEIAQEVFTAAGDPNVFPELTKEGILPWQPLKMYARVPMQAISDKGLFDYATGQYVPAEFTNYITHTTSHTQPMPDVIVHEGETDPLLTIAAAAKDDLPPTLASADPATPLSYVQFARIGLGLQRSQIGPGVRNAPRGTVDIAYHRYGSKLEKQPAHEDSFFDAVDIHVNGMSALAPALPEAQRNAITQLSARLAQTEATFEKLPSPQLIAPELAADLQSLDRIIDSVQNDVQLPSPPKADLLHELRVKRVQMNDALVVALGVQVTAESKTADLVEKQAATATFEIAYGQADKIQLHAIRSENRNGVVIKTPYEARPPASPFGTECSLGAEQLDSPRAPYFIRRNLEDAVYDTSRALDNAPEAPADFSCYLDFSYANIPLTVGSVASHDGQPAQVYPAGSIALSSHAQVLPNSASTFHIAVTTTPQSLLKDSIALTTPDGWHASARLVPNAAAPEQLVYTVRVPVAKRTSQTLSVCACSQDGTQQIENTDRIVGYGDLPRTQYFTQASDRIVPVDLNLPGPTHRHIGYLPGTGDAVPEALASVGLPVTPLTVADLTPEKLKQFDTVILGVRTYNAHPELHGAPTQALFDFARNGGNVVVQYQTMEFTAADAPFPLSLGSNEKVVDETAPVRLLDTANPLLSTPNRIAPADFNGWNEERGHGFLSTWDAHYTALTETHDPGEPAEHIQPQAPQRGGLISTPLGKGRWTYVAFALYRQLPEAVPGAFRLFVNLIAAAQPPTR